MSNISDKIIHYTKQSIFPPRIRGKYFSSDNVLEMFQKIVQNFYLNFLILSVYLQDLLKTFLLGKFEKLIQCKFLVTVLFELIDKIYFMYQKIEH